MCGRVEWSGGNLVCWWVKAVKAVKPVPSSHHTPSANRTYTELIAAYVIQFLRFLVIHYFEVTMVCKPGQKLRNPLLSS